MVWECGKNGWVSYGQKGVDGRVNGWWVRGTPRLNWMDGVKEALGNRGMTVAAARKTGKGGEPWYICNWISFTPPFLLGTVFFRTALPCSGSYHLERGGMPLHDAVGINCKMAQLLKIKYMGIYSYLAIVCLPVCLSVCLSVCLFWHDMITLHWWRKKVIVY